MFKQRLIRLWKDEDGLGTLELLLILAVIVIIAIAFRKWIVKWVSELFNKADSEITNTNFNDTNLNPPGS